MKCFFFGYGHFQRQPRVTYHLLGVSPGTGGGGVSMILRGRGGWEGGEAGRGARAAAKGLAEKTKDSGSQPHSLWRFSPPLYIYAHCIVVHSGFVSIGTQPGPVGVYEAYANVICLPKRRAQVDTVMTLQ